MATGLGSSVSWNEQNCPAAAESRLRKEMHVRLEEPFAEDMSVNTLFRFRSLACPQFAS